MIVHGWYMTDAKAIESNVKSTESDVESTQATLVKKYIVSLYGYLDDDEKAEILESVQETITNKAFKDNPQTFLEAWKEERGDTEDFCVGEDGAFDILTRMVDAGQFEGLRGGLRAPATPESSS